jgi:hypothetical protein
MKATYVVRNIGTLLLCDFYFDYRLCIVELKQHSHFYFWQLNLGFYKYIYKLVFSDCMESIRYLCVKNQRMQQLFI